jgi:predicted RNA methylase
MAKLSKAQFKLHQQAEDILTKPALTIEDKEFVLENWDPSARHVNSADGAFFTPPDLATSFACMLGHPGTIIDLCAGIGALSHACTPVYGAPPRIVCVEKNPDYVRVGRKIVPHAEWIEGDVFDVLDMGLGRFDAAIGNPPFGKVAKGGKSAPGVSADFEFHVIAIGMAMADYGQFILLQMSAGFAYSGRPHYERAKEGKAFAFQQKHGFHFECVSIDTDFARSLWKGTAPATEVVSVERVDTALGVAKPAANDNAPQLSLFSEAA